MPRGGASSTSMKPCVTALIDERILCGVQSGLEDELARVDMGKLRSPIEEVAGAPKSRDREGGGVHRV